MSDRRQGSVRPPARFEEHVVGYAIGDVHGRADLLEAMLDTIEAEAGKRSDPHSVIVFLGDYIDRGPNSRGVIDLLLSDRLSSFSKIFLKGNHEQAMLEFLDGAPRSRYWLAHGGLDTLASYGVALPAIGAGTAVMDETRKQFRDALPKAHRDFFGGLSLMHVCGDYLFVHAGIDPRLAIADQTVKECCWIRKPFLEDGRPLPYRVVHGHTPAALPHIDSRRIGLDTGAYATGVLSAVRLEGTGAELLQVGTIQPVGPRW